MFFFFYSSAFYLIMPHQLYERPFFAEITTAGRFSRIMRHLLVARIFCILTSIRTHAWCMRTCAYIQNASKLNNQIISVRSINRNN